MPRTVMVNSGLVRHVQNISVGPHLLQADEPRDSGGNDVGPNPYELLLSALGACTSMTLRMYAERKQWPLQDVQVRLAHSKIYTEDCVACDTKQGMPDQIHAEISLVGDLSDDQPRKSPLVHSNWPSSELASRVSGRERIVLLSITYAAMVRRAV